MMLNEIKMFLKTLAFFLLAYFLLPVLLLTFLWVHYGNKFINYLLTVKYPTIILSKSKKIRSLIDTPRNAGIFNFLLCIKGTCDLQQIRQKYTDELLDKSKSGHFKFIKLRQTLVTCWGNYAWEKDISSFNINNHIILNTRNYRGRPVSDANIQDFVSDLVTKYIPSNLPQWQVIIIPCFQGVNENNTEYLKADHYYLLVKVHHLIIAEEPDLHISELLMLESNEPNETIKFDDFNQTPGWQNLSHFINKPEHIVKLWRSLKYYCIKQWNAFIYEFDSLDAHDDGCLATVTVNNLTKLLSLLLIVTVNVCRAYFKWLQIRKNNKRKCNLYAQTSHMQMLIKLLQSELDKHHLSWPVAVEAIRNTLHPLNLGHIVLKFLIMFMLLPIFLPIYCIRETIALVTVLLKTKKVFENSHSEQMIYCAKLCICALWEFMEILYELFKAPLNIYEELFEKPTSESNILQMKSYSGRKIVCFSKCLDVRNLQNRNVFDKSLQECDFTLACLARAINDYFAVYEDFAAVPEILNTTCRTISKEYLTDKCGEKTDYIGGVVFLQLPLKKPIWENAKEIHKRIKEIRKKQLILYLASIGQTKFDLITALLPQVLTKVFINYFAYNFPVTITDIHGSHANFRTYWGHQVEDVLLFRPPQSKTCLSLNIHRFGDRIRLAVMADTQLAPHHTKITQAFERYLENTTL